MDIWSVGCIFAEIVNRKALFAGNNEEEQLAKIVRLRGIPSSEEWPGITALPLFGDFEHVLKEGEKTKPPQLEELVKGLDREGLDLLDKMLQCNPANRITAKQAMEHPFLADVPDIIKKMK